MKGMERDDYLRKLMIASLNGDQAAYGQFLSEVSMVVKGYLLKKSGHLGNEKIEDLVQELLIAIHLKKTSYRQDLPIMPWIYTIAKHKLYDELRSEKRRFAFLQSLLANDENSTDATSSFENQEELETILAGIPVKQKEILLLAKVEKMPLQEIATQMKMSLSSVKITVHRAIKGIRGK